MSNVMTTKSDTLLFVREYVKKSFVEDIIIIKVGEFLKNKTVTFQIIAEEFKGDAIIVRSSCRDDRYFNKNTGSRSVSDVKSDDKEQVTDAITRVIYSYIDGEVTEEALGRICDEQILVQRQATDIVMTGEVYTRDILHNRPYYMVTYDEFEALQSITGGRGQKTRWIARNVSREFLDDRFYKLLDAVKEIEQIFCDIDALDIEFAIDSNECVIIFQVRPLDAVIGAPKSITDHEFMDTKAFAKCNYLDNNQVLSNRAYVNPAEIIGNNPRPLDYALYRTLITEKMWNIGLSEIGYSKTDEELMTKVGNRPYISVRTALSCFIPATVDERLKEKLINFYEDCFKYDKTTYDKSEDKIFSTFDMNVSDKLKILRENGFTEEECRDLKDRLREFTIGIINDYDRISQKDDVDLERLADIRHEIRASAPLTETNSMKLYGYINTLIEAMKQYVTPQYVRHNRCAYVAKSICRSLVEQGYFSAREMNGYIASITTVFSEFKRDFERYCDKTMTKADFDRLYGHLRLGMYDIRTDCYKKMYKELEDVIPRAYIPEKPKKKLRSDLTKLQKAIDDCGMDIEPEKLVDYIIKTKKNKERYKSEYTKSLSLLLDIIIRLGETLGIAREDMSYLEVQELLSYHSRDTYIQIITERRMMYYANTYLVLPDVILGVGNVDVVDVDEVEPYFVTDRTVEAEIVNLDDNKEADVTGRIVVLTKASAGYDWLFTRNIAGLITKYGSGSSHIVSRCKEFNIPAAIGCGEKTYIKVSQMARARFDCANGKIKEL